MWLYWVAVVGELPGSILMERHSQYAQSENLLNRRTGYADLEIRSGICFLFLVRARRTCENLKKTHKNTTNEEPCNVLLFNKNAHFARVPPLGIITA